MKIKDRGRGRRSIQAEATPCLGYVCNLKFCREKATAWAHNNLLFLQRTKFCQRGFTAFIPSPYRRASSSPLSSPIPRRRNHERYHHCFNPDPSRRGMAIYRQCGALEIPQAQEQTHLSPDRASR